MDVTRCFLTETGLPKRLWGELASTAVFLKSRIPHSALSSDTPYYRMVGKNADLSFLQAIGSRAFVHEEGSRAKVDQRAWEGVLVGYNNDSQRTGFFIILRVRDQKLALARKISLRRLWWLMILMKGVRVQMILKMHTMEYKR